MIIEQILFSIVSVDPGVVAILGSGSACRFYPDEIPSNETMPAVSYEIVIGLPEGVMNGAPVGDNARIQINSFSDAGYDAARALSEAVERALENRDAMIAHDVGIRCISWNGCDYDSELKRHRDSKDYSFWTSR